MANVRTRRPGPGSRGLEECHINQHKYSHNSEDAGYDDLHELRGRDFLHEGTELSTDYDTGSGKYGYGENSLHNRGSLGDE